MAPPPAHFVRLAGVVRGPLRLEHVREMAESGVITPETEIAPAADGPWVPLAALPLCAEIMPVRRVLGFKAAEFDQLNQGSAPAMDPNEVILQANQPPASFRGREVAVTPLGRLGPRAGGANEVQAMVLEVGRRVAANAPPVVLPPPPARFPRWRWFLALGVLGTAFILCIPRFYPDRKSDEFTFSILAGWIVLYDGFLVLVMVMERGVRERLRLRSLEPDKKE